MKFIVNLITYNNGFGLTATLSGTDASSFEISQTQTNGTYRLSPSTTFNFASLFGTPNNGVYPETPALSWSVTDNGGLSSTPATVIGFIGFHVFFVYRLFLQVSLCFLYLFMGFHRLR